MIELRNLTNRYAIAQWEQLYAALEAKPAQHELLEDIAEIILNLRDIAALLEE